MLQRAVKRLSSLHFTVRLYAAHCGVWFNESRRGYQTVGSLRCSAILLFCLGLPCVASAQKEQRQPLTDTQVEKIREAGIYPNERIKLYTQFLDEHAESIKGLTNRSKTDSRSKRLDDELLDFTALVDEMGSNLDQYTEREADLRPALKTLNELTPKWRTILNALPGQAAFNEARKEAIEAEEDLADQGKRLLTEQETYFAAHKEAKGQERAEPQ